MKKAIIDLLIGTWLLTITVCVWAFPIKNTINWFLSDLIGTHVSYLQALAIVFLYSMLDFEAKEEVLPMENRLNRTAIHVITALYIWAIIYFIYIIT